MFQYEANKSESPLGCIESLGKNLNTKKVFQDSQNNFLDIFLDPTQEHKITRFCPV